LSKTSQGKVKDDEKIKSMNDNLAKMVEKSINFNITPKEIDECKLSYHD
jgi:hypothetical protein